MQRSGTFNLTSSSRSRSWKRSCSPAQTGSEGSNQTAEPSFIDQLAAGTPTPGGGSASAFTGAEAAALVAMVARLTVGKKKYAAVEPQMWEVISQADSLRAELAACVAEDSAAFEDLMAAMRLPKDTEDQLAIRVGSR